jgi:monoamine oxidase
LIAGVQWHSAVNITSKFPIRRAIITSLNMSSVSATRESVDVVVIGAGLSGLRAALLIQAAEFSCAVVEAIDRVGGKTLSLPSKKSGPGVNDLGAAWINDTTQSEMYQLVQKYGLQGEIQMDRGNDVWELDEGVILSPHGVLPVRLSPFLAHL